MTRYCTSRFGPARRRFASSASPPCSLRRSQLLRLAKSLTAQFDARCTCQSRRSPAQSLQPSLFPTSSSSLQRPSHPFAADPSPSYASRHRLPSRLLLRPSRRSTRPVNTHCSRSLILRTRRPSPSRNPSPQSLGCVPPSPPSIPQTDPRKEGAVQAVHRLYSKALTEQQNAGRYGALAMGVHGHTYEFEVKFRGPLCKAT